MTTPTLPQGKRYLTVRQAAQAYPAFSESSLRWMLFNRKENGLCSCTLEIGRRILIDAAKWELWLDSQVSK